MIKQSLLALGLFVFSFAAFAQEKPCGGQSGSLYPNGGGFVSDSAKIIGDPHISANSMVCDFATIEGSSVSIDFGSKVAGFSYVKGKVTITSSIVEGNAFLDGTNARGLLSIDLSRIYGQAKLYDDVDITNSLIYGQAVLRGNSIVLYSEIYGKARLTENAYVGPIGALPKSEFEIPNTNLILIKVHGKTQITGNAKILSEVSSFEVCDDIIFSNNTIIKSTHKYCSSTPQIPDISVYPDRKIFADTPIGSVSNPEVFAFVNEGAADATGCSAAQLIGDTSDFEVSFNSCSVSILVAEGGYCSVQLKAKPQTVGSKKLTLSMNCSVGGLVKTIDQGISYTATDASLMSVSPLEAVLAPTMVGEASSSNTSFVFQNSGSQVITGCSAPVLADQDKDDFSIVEDYCGTSDLVLLSGGNTTYSFDNSIGFSLSDPSQIEVANGVVTLKKGHIPTATLFASYNTSINGDLGLGSLVGTAFGSANVSTGALNLNFNNISYVDYDPVGKDNFDQLVAARLRIIPNYNGSPSSNQAFLTTFASSSSDINRFQVYHDATSGELKVVAWDNAGTQMISSGFGLFNAVSGQEYEIEINSDFINGETRLFVDGVQFGPTVSAVVNRVGVTATAIRIGSNRYASLASNFSVSQFALFNSIQHTTNYTMTSDWLSFSQNNPYIELSSAISIASALKNFKERATYSNGDLIRYLLSDDNGATWKYWNGFSWALSNESLAQTSTALTISQKISLLGQNGQIKFRAYLHSGTGQTTPLLDEIVIGDRVGECEVRIAPRPTSSGEKKATLTRTCTSSGSVSTHKEGITYSALNPVLNVIPSSFHYGTYNLSVPSSVEVFTFRNDSGALAQFCSAPVILGAHPTDFIIVSDSCGTSTLASGQSCDVSVQATAQDIGTRSATLFRNCVQGGVASTVANGLTIFGEDQLPVIKISPENLDFGNLLAGEVSDTFEIKINNIGGTDATGCSPAALTGAHPSEFEIVADDCSASDLPANIGQCSIYVRAKPIGIDLRTADLTRNCVDGGLVTSVLEVQSQVLSPMPELSFSPMSYDFGPAPIGSTYNTQTFTISNLGNADAEKCSTVYLTGKNFDDFLITADNCGSSDLPAMSTCTIDVTTNPNQLGIIKATLTRTCLIGGTVKTLSNGIIAESRPNTPDLSISPLTFDYGGVSLGSSLTQNFTISNSGFGSATGCSAPTIDGDTSDFTISLDGCGTNNVAQNSTCDIALDFIPQSGGAKSLNLRRNCTVGGEVVSTITATGVSPNLEIAPLSFDFGNIEINQSSVQQLFSITNTGDGPAIGCTTPIISGADSAQFSLSIVNCPDGNMSPQGGTCSVNVQFAPTSRLLKTATLERSCTIGGTISAVLNGTGSGPILSTVPSPIDFGYVANNQVTPNLTVTLTNSGDAIATGCGAYTLETGNNAEFEIVSGTDTCTSSLGIGQSCTVDLRAIPTTLGPKSTLLRRTCSNGSLESSVLAESANPTLNMAPLAYDFGETMLGAYSAQHTFTVSNPGPIDIGSCSAPILSGVNASDFAFTTASNCSDHLNVGESCSIYVSAHPVNLGSVIASLDFTCPLVGTFSSALTATGVPIFAKMPIIPSQYDFLKVGMGNSSASKIFKVTNTSGGKSKLCSPPALLGTDANQFKILSATCSTDMNVMDSCEIEVVSTPTSLGIKTAFIERDCTIGGKATANIKSLSESASPMISFLQNSYQFPKVHVLSTGQVFYAKVRNDGPGIASSCAPASLVGGNASEFSIIDDQCASNNLSAQSVCLIAVESRATSVGSKSTSLVRACGIGGTASMQLSATAENSDSSLSFSKKEHDFLSIGVNHASQILNLTFTNLGAGSARNCSAPVLLGGDATSFAIVQDSCSTLDLGPKESCQIQVMATPDGLGLKNALLSRACGFGGTAQTSLKVTGVSVNSEQEVTPSSLAFGSSTTGQNSKQQVFKFSNKGVASLRNCSSATLQGTNASDFSIVSDNCSGVLNSHESCQVVVEARPASTGIKVAQLGHACAIGGDATASLSVEGKVGDSAILANHSQLDFGSVTSGQATKVVDLVITNSSLGVARSCAAPVLSGANASDFSISSDTCGSQDLNSSQACHIGLSAIPSTLGQKSATLDYSCALGGSISIDLKANSVSGPLSLTVNPPSYQFAPTVVGNSSAMKKITFNNFGEGKVSGCSVPTLTGINSTDFEIEVDQCLTNSLDAGSSCFVQVFAKPQSIGLKSATLERICTVGGTVSSNLTTIAKLGNPALSFSPSEHDFLVVGENQLSKQQIFKVINNGSGPVKGCSAPVLEGADATEFSIITLSEKSCDTNDLASGDYCQFAIESAPTSLAKKEALVRRTCSTGGSVTASLRSMGKLLPSSIVMAPKAFNFQNVGVGHQSPERVFTFLNNGSGYLRGCTSPQLTGANSSDFSIDYASLLKPCSSVTALAPGDFCQGNISSIPADLLGGRTAQVSFSCTKGGSIQGDLYANGIDPDFPTLLLRPQVLTLSKNEISTIEIFNIGFADALNCAPLSLVGRDSKNLVLIDDDCDGQKIHEGESCAIKVKARAEIERAYGFQKCGEIIGMNTIISNKKELNGSIPEPINWIDDCSLSNEGEIHCFDKVQKRDSALKKLPFIKEMYKKENKLCFKTLTNNEICQ